MCARMCVCVCVCVRVCVCACVCARACALQRTGPQWPRAQSTTTFSPRQSCKLFAPNVHKSGDSSRSTKFTEPNTLTLEAPPTLLFTGLPPGSLCVLKVGALSLKYNDRSGQQKPAMDKQLIKSRGTPGQAHCTRPPPSHPGCARSELEQPALLPHYSRFTDSWSLSSKT